MDFIFDVISLLGCKLTRVAESSVLTSVGLSVRIEVRLSLASFSRPFFKSQKGDSVIRRVKERSTTGAATWIARAIMHWR